MKAGKIIALFLPLASLISAACSHLSGGGNFGVEDELARIQNENFILALSSSKGIVLIDRSDGSKYCQLPAQFDIKNVSVSGGEIFYEICSRGASMRANLKFAGDSEFELALSGDGDMPAPVAYPSAWKMQKGDIGFYPIGTGYAFPVDMQDIPLPKKQSCVGGVGWSMGMFAFKRGNFYLLSAVEQGVDAEILNFKNAGLAHTAVNWISEKGKFGYPRKMRFIAGKTLAEIMGAYREYRKSMGYVKTLSEKARELPHLEQMKGAADFWIWEDNMTNRLYGRPEIPNRPARNVRAIADEMQKLGIDRVLWNYIEPETPEDCRYLKSLGFIVGKYDIYRDVLPADIAHKIIKCRVERSVNTKYWPDIVNIDENGERRKAWKVHGKDGKMYWQNSVCEIAAYELTKINVPAELKNIPYNSRFIDVQAATQVRECYSPKHPATRRVGAEYIRKQQDYLTSLGLINGVECGHEIYVAHYHYAEGLLSPAKFRVPDSGRKMTHVHLRSDMPAQTEKFMLNPQFRVPLWELVYHDCAVNYWYWGDSNCCCPELMYKFDNFNALYGYPPIYSLDVTHWNSLKNEIAASYKRASAVARKVAFERMTDFEYLTDDKKVQRTTFSNGISVIANFSDAEYRAENGKIIAPWSYAMEGEI